MSDSNETFLGMIYAAQKAGEVRYYAVIFTTSRIIIALTTSESKWYIGKDMMTSLWSRQRANELIAMTPDAILKADQLNFFILHSDIKSIIMKRARLGRLFFSGSVEILTDDGKYGYLFRDQTFDECVNLVKNVIPDKLTIEQ